MEDLIRALVGVDSWFAWSLVAMSFALAGWLGWLQFHAKQTTGVAPRMVTPDQLRIAILEQCGDCAKIVSLNGKIDQLHEKLDELAIDHEATKGEIYRLTTETGIVRRTVERLETRLDQLMPHLARVLDFKVGP